MAYYRKGGTLPPNAYFVCSTDTNSRLTCSTDMNSHGRVGKNTAQKMSIHHCTNFLTKWQGCVRISAVLAIDGRSFYCDAGHAACIMCVQLSSSAESESLASFPRLHPIFHHFQQSHTSQFESESCLAMITARSDLRANILVQELAFHM